jgi:hypothetical protein
VGKPSFGSAGSALGTEFGGVGEDVRRFLVPGFWFFAPEQFGYGN